MLLALDMMLKAVLVEVGPMMADLTLDDVLVCFQLNTNVSYIPK